MRRRARGSRPCTPEASVGGCLAKGVDGASGAGAGTAQCAWVDGGRDADASWTFELEGPVPLLGLVVSGSAALYALLLVDMALSP